MKADEIKQLLSRINNDPSILGAERDELDRLLVEIITVEKKHLFGVAQTSTQRRQEEIQKHIDNYLKNN